MASDTNIKKRKAAPAKRKSKPGRSIGFSALARAIFLSNMVGLLILIIGALTLNEIRGGLINTKESSLLSVGQLITSIIAADATGDAAVPQLDPQTARLLLRDFNLGGARARLWDMNGNLIADSDALSTDVDVEPLENIDDKPVPTDWTERAQNAFRDLVGALPSVKKRREKLRYDLSSDVRLSLTGLELVGPRYTQDDELIVTASLPVQRVGAVLGVVTLETADVEMILAAERRSLAPIIGLAFITALLSSLALTLFIALPVRSLARAADDVQRSASNRGAIPDLSGRNDEIGDLSIVLRDMTAALYDRIDDIANFAADVAHEIKNPLTSLRSATETLTRAKTPEQKEKLIGIIQNDVERMDRLISDISKASRMDAELAREEATPVDIETMLRDMAALYHDSGVDKGKTVRYIASDNPEPEPIIVRGSPSALGQVFTNLIDNALTFSPEKGEVRLRVRRGKDEQRNLAIITVDDDGPGIPPDNLTSIFERFYTERPKGAAFGKHSGLGLAICRQIVRAHQGIIFAENRAASGSERPDGAKFTVQLPIAKSE